MELNKEFKQKISTFKVELAESKASAEKLKKTVEKATASEPVNEEIYCALNEMCSYMMDRMYRLEDRLYSLFWEHEEGHLPPIKGAGSMEQALKALGLDADYEVRKPVVFAKNNIKVDLCAHE